MIERNQIIRLRVPEAMRPALDFNAKQARLNGRSRVRDKADRKENLGIDQLSGQIAQYVATTWWLGDPRWYLVSRYHANQHPHEGDGGIDIPGTNIDIKSSIMRDSPHPLNYHLPVRPEELHDDRLYWLVLIEHTLDWAHIVGWATTEMLVHQGFTRPDFGNARLLAARDLNPFPPVKYNWLIKARKDRA